jgi:hypothetical protein
VTAAAIGLDERPAPPVVAQDVAARAALVCHRGPSYQPEWTYWDSIEQARQARTELGPCGPLCIEVHTAVRIPNAPNAPPRPAVATRRIGTGP